MGLMKLKTVAIANADGTDYIIINESDYNPDDHIEWPMELDATTTTITLTTLDLPPEPEPEPEPAADLAAQVATLMDQHTVADLEAIARDLDLVGFSTMKKAELAEAIAIAQSAG
jgi:hypothetical protein